MTAKEAAQKAKGFLIELLGEEVMEIRLEEVGQDERGGFWYITLSYYLQGRTPLAQIIGTHTGERIYKKFKIQNDPDGNVVDMKIRELEHTM